MATDDEIRALCLLVLQAKCNPQFEDSICNLRVALTERFLDIENRGIHLLLNMSKQLSPVSEKANHKGSNKDEPDAA